MLKLNWQDFCYRSIGIDAFALDIGTLHVDNNETLDFGGSVGLVSVKALHKTASELSDLMGRANYVYPILLAFSVFMTTRRPQALNGYFPLINTLNEAEEKSFYALSKEIMLHQGFDFRLLDESLFNIAPRQPQFAYFAAARIAEVFFYRRDILERLLNAKCCIWLYTSRDAFRENGGVSGGSFNGSRGCVELVISRLFDGFHSPTPGAAPFLHEFGHLLDFLDAGHDVVGKSSGFLPGMRMIDGEIYKPEARELFLKGKRLELERYMRLYDGAPPADPLPIGHPYVFQNDTEFIAGYLEMFFRNPHYFAAQNPDLFQAFMLTFGWDTRKAWAKDYPYYIDQNRGFYLSGKKPGKPGLTLPG